MRRGRGSRGWQTWKFRTVTHYAPRDARDADIILDFPVRCYSLGHPPTKDPARPMSVAFCTRTAAQARKIVAHLSALKNARSSIFHGEGKDAPRVPLRARS